MVGAQEKEPYVKVVVNLLPLTTEAKFFEHFTFLDYHIIDLVEWTREREETF